MKKGPAPRLFDHCVTFVALEVVGNKILGDFFASLQVVELGFLDEPIGRSVAIRTIQETFAAIRALKIRNLLLLGDFFENTSLLKLPQTQTMNFLAAGRMLFVHFNSLVKVNGMSTLKMGFDPRSNNVTTDRSLKRTEWTRPILSLQLLVRNTFPFMIWCFNQLLSR